MEIELDKNYSAQESESGIYARWEASGYFNPDTCIERGVTPANAEPFTIMMPPPNVTGILHMGHALMLTVEDILVRYARMRGRRTLWLPGTDHAAIATQSRVEKDIYKQEGISRHDLGREEFLRRVEQFARKSHDTITSQIRAIGASCDWSREAYTLDEQRSRAVRTMFKRMYDDGLIYRGNRIVNWDPKGQTTISDDEIVYEERPAKLWTFRYSKDFPISIATTRPETKLGDTGIAVNPDDERYAAYVGKEYDVEFCGTPLHITVVADKEVDPEFGTGAVGLTPAHSMTDWEIAQRHNLPAAAVINEHARISLDGSFKDMKVAQAREAIVTQLEQSGLLEKTEDITQNIATAERTGGVIEPLPKLQWFVAVDKEFTGHDGTTTTLKRLMHDAVASEKIAIIPEHFSKTYFHWIDTLRDWCISRQIWYGHRIPVWYRGDEIVAGTEAPAGEGWERDPDTLDTWFSSGLWTFSTLGWPDDTADLHTYHPTNVLETGYEILFFWVARMILMTEYALGDIPFRTVYLHGTVRDAKGRKMSKSLGNGIDPIDVVNEFGADAGRMALVVGNTPGTDSRISTDKIRGYKHFANKLWNIARFILASTDDVDFSQTPVPQTDADRSILAALDRVTQTATDHLEHFRLYEAAQELYQFAWHELADIYLEASKEQLADATTASSTRIVLAHCLATTLRLLHPFVPFVTETLYEKLPPSGRRDAELLMIARWPTPVGGSTA